MTFDNKELRHIVWGSNSPEVHSAVELICSVSETLARMMTHSDNGASSKALDAIDVAMFHARRAVMEGAWDVAHINQVANENPSLEWMRANGSIDALPMWKQVATEMGDVMVSPSWSFGASLRLQNVLRQSRFWLPEFDNGSTWIRIGEASTAHVIAVGHEFYEKMGDMIEWVLNAAYAGKRIDAWEPVAEGDKESRYGESRQLGGEDCGVFNPDADGGDNEDNTFTSRSRFAGKHCRIFQRHFGRGNLNLFGHDLTENELAAFELLAGHLERCDMPNWSNMIAYDTITVERLITSSVTDATNAENATHLPEGMVLIDAKELENLRAGVREDLTQGVHIAQNDRGSLVLRGKGYNSEEIACFRALGEAIRDGELKPKSVNEPYVSDHSPLLEFVVPSARAVDDMWTPARAFLHRALHSCPEGDKANYKAPDFANSFVLSLSEQGCESLMKSVIPYNAQRRIAEISEAARSAEFIMSSIGERLRLGDDAIRHQIIAPEPKALPLWACLSEDSQRKFAAHYHNSSFNHLDLIIRNEAQKRSDSASRTSLAFVDGEFVNE